MVMETLQIRLSKETVQHIDAQVKSGRYSSRSDAVRDKVRSSFWHDQIGTVKLKGSGVSLVRKARKYLSKQTIDLDKINKELDDL